MRWNYKIEDNGIGIPKDQLERVFERFTQVESSAARPYEGTGIGLALAKELVILHGGKISAESTLGKGTIFSVTIPRGNIHELDPTILTDDKSSALEFPQIPINSSMNKATLSSVTETENVHKYNVLAIDDNADMRDYLQRLLKQRFTVEVAADGIEGLEKARDLRPDIVVTDAMMPRMKRV